MKIRRISIISLICIMCITFMPMNLYALEDNAVNGDVTVESTQDIIDESVQDMGYTPFSGYNENVETCDLADYQLKKDNTSFRSKSGSSVVSSTFTANEQKLYNDLLPKMRSIAEGDLNSSKVVISVGSYFPKTTYTKSDLGVSSFVNSTETALSDEAITKIDNELNMDFGKVTFALFTNKPFEMYWFDKTNMNTSYSYIDKVNISGDRNTMDTSQIELIFEFPVEKEYSATNATKTLDLNSTLTKSVSTKTQAKAKEVVNQVTSNNKTHYDILKAYMDWVCGAVDYNQTVKLTDDYGNPWQMVWVFDDDDSTKVVCEGYSKAFKYLCDLTPELTNDGIEVYLMLGDLGGNGITPQPHMWNVVHMTDGKNYLVDCTNMDPQAIKWENENLLFMAGAPKESGTADGQASDKYSFSDGKTDVNFTYSSLVMSLFTPVERDLASTSYNASNSTTPSDPTQPTQPTTTDPTTDNPTTDPTVDNPTTNPTTEEPVVEDPEVTDGADEDIDEDDGAIEDDEDEDSTSAKGQSTVKTGDDTNIILYAVILVLAIAAVVALVLVNRKKNKKE